METPKLNDTMVEVFKTSVRDPYHANIIVDQIHKTFAYYMANFDLEDCDKILRVKSTTGFIEASCILNLVKDFGFHAEVLPDDFFPGDSLLLKSILSLHKS